MNPFPPGSTYFNADDSWWTPARFSVVLGGLIFISFPQVVIGLESFVVRDFGFFAYPLAYFQRECFWRGELPFWNPYNFCGVPFLAQWNTMPLYPPAILYLLFPLGWSLSFFCLAHLLFAGVGFYFLAHRWTGSRFAASVAGVIFAFNGMTFNLLMWPSHIATLSWAPWVVWLVEMAWERGGSAMFIAALSGAMQMLAGGPETILLTWLLLATIWLIQLFWPGGGRTSGVGRTVLLWRFPFMVLLVACLTAAQLFPFLDLVAHSQRGHDYSDTTASMPAWGWANFLVPMVFGSARVQHMFFQHWQSWTSSYYLGIVALLLTVVAVAFVRQWRVRLLAAASLLALLMAIGDRSFLYRWLCRLVPQLTSISHPVKFVLVTTFAAPMLAAFATAGPQRVQQQQRLKFEKLLVATGGVLFAMIAGILLWAWRFPFPWDDFAATLQNGLSRAGLLILGLALLLVRQRSLQPRIRRVLEGALLLTLWFDTWTHEPQQNPTAPPAIFAPEMARRELAMEPQPALGESRAMVTPEAQSKFLWVALDDPKDDFLAKRLGYCANCNLLDHVPKVDGFFSLYSRESAGISALLYATNASFPRLEDFMGVSQIIARGEVVKWNPRSTFLPLVTAGQRPIFSDDISILRGLVRPDFSPRSMVFLPSNEVGRVSVSPQTQARIFLKQVTGQTVEFDAESIGGPSLAVIAQTYYRGWRAFVDGSPSNLLRANFAFQAVEVPNGLHHVRLVYREPTFVVGAAISLVTFIYCIAGALKFGTLKSKSKSDEKTDSSNVKSRPA